MDDHYDDTDDALARHLSTHNNNHGDSRSNSPSYSHSDFRHSAIDPSLENISTNGSNRESPGHQPHNGTINPRQLPQNVYPKSISGSLWPPTPSDAAPTVSPRFSTHQDTQKLLPAFTPNDRHLPSIEVTDENLDDAYVQFILYCNPTVPLSTDSAELRRGFRQPPKSDGKTFNTYVLLELLRKFDNKEIKTWGQLAMDLGVEPPNLEKNQSVQKVQQYAVRLKVSFL
jgi:ARS binding protein 2